MASVVYVGPFDVVEVEHQVGAPWAGVAYRGTPIEVPDHVATGLLDQPTNWAVPAPTKKKSTASEAEGSDT